MLKTDEINENYGWGIRHLQMACMFMGVTALFTARGCMGVAVLAMTDTHRGNATGIEIYEWDKQTQGLVLSSFFWGYCVMQIPAGLLAKRFGGKPTVMVALLCSGIICLLIPLMAHIGGWGFVCAARVMMGLTQAFLYPSAHMLLGRWLPGHERTTYGGIVYGGAQLGTVISMPLSGLLADTDLGWKLIFYTMAGLLLTVASIWWIFTASSPNDHRWLNTMERHYIQKGLQDSSSYKSVKTPWLAMLRSTPLWAIMFGHLGCAIFFTLFFVDLPTYLEKGLEISLKSSAFLSALPYLGMWAGTLIASSAFDKLINGGYFTTWTGRKIFNSLASFGISAALIAIAFMGKENKTIILILLVAGFVMGGLCGGGFLVNHLDLSPHYAGVLLSLTNTLANVGSFLTPLITSWILQNDPTDISRWRLVFLSTAFIVILLNILYIMFGSSKLQPWDDPDFMIKAQSKPEELKPALKKKEKAEENNSE